LFASLAGTRDEGQIISNYLLHFLPLEEGTLFFLKKSNFLNLNTLLNAKVHQE